MDATHEDELGFANLIIAEGLLTAVVGGRIPKSKHVAWECGGVGPPRMPAPVVADRHRTLWHVNLQRWPCLTTPVNKCREFREFRESTRGHGTALTLKGVVSF
jgi:hypothetical protein